jgi:hypothetical protein
MFSTPAKKYFVFLTSISLLGIGVAAFSTSNFGAGVSSDAVTFMSTADNLLHGRGFVDLTGEPLVFWPPLYPVILACLSLIARTDVFVAGWYLNVFSFGLNIWLGGMLLYEVFRENRIWAYIGSISILISPSLFRISINIASDPLLITFTLTGLILAARYLATKSRRLVVPIALIAGLASLQRYAGGALTLTMLVLIAIVNKDDLKRAALENLKFVTLASGPVGAWILLHNYLQYQTLFGPWPASNILPVENVAISLKRMLDWFIPVAMIGQFLPAVCLLAAGALLFINNRGHWSGWLHDLSKDAVLPSLMFAVIYLGVLAFTVVTTDHLSQYRFDDRYQLILFVPVLIVLYTTLQRLLLSHLPIKHRMNVYLLLIGLICWAIYPIHLTAMFIWAALEKGEPTYNIYNTRAYRDSKVVRALDVVIKDSHPTLYSNYTSALWFYTRQQVYTTPRLGNNQIITEDSYKQFAGWPEKAGYLVWFAPNIYKHVLPPEELNKIADMDLLFQDEDGEIYFVQPRMSVSHP